jgi:hypothetical protein
MRALQERDDVVACPAGELPAMKPDGNANVPDRRANHRASRFAPTSGGSNAFVCMHCGAALALQDGALDALCHFCQQRTLVPKHILALRTPNVVMVPSDDPLRGLGLVLLGAAALFAAIGAVLFFMWRTSNSLSSAPTAPSPSATAPSASSTAAERSEPKPQPPSSSSAAAESSAPTISDPDDPRLHGTGAVRADALLTSLERKGCGHVIMPPTVTSREQGFNSRFKMNGMCVTLIAVSGESSNKLALRMKSPQGAPIATPPPSAEVVFTYCPQTPGPHPSKITPMTNDKYTVAAIECPASTKQKRP